ncbi:MAG: hypothetical protein RDU30_08870 [Desulfovibrionaceae bacterium]|nr:hypothetical protein [Desulfovibrionaceae bacterium]
MAVCSPTALFRCDASPERGYGHVSRCLSVARAIRAVRPWRIVFALGSDHAAQRVRGRGLEVSVRSSGEAMAAWLERILRELSPQALFLDAPQGFPEALAARRHAAGGLTVVLDDAGPLRRHGDAAYYPPAPAAYALDWTGCGTEVLCGFQWAPLGEAFVRHPRVARTGPPRLLVTMGGSDPAGLALRAAELLMTPPLSGTPWSALFVVGPYFAMKHELAVRLDRLDGRAEMVESPQDMGALMAASDFALASFGVSAYELAASGVPAAYYCLTGEHAAMAGVFAREGMAISFGVHDAVRQDEAARRTAELLRDPLALERMGRRAASLVDGKGAQRIAADLVRRVESLI